MSNLIDLSDYRRRNKKQRIRFDRTELRTLLNVYSMRVAQGEWKDYAVDQHGPVAIFSIFRHSYETPVFAVAKRTSGKGFEYLVLSGRRILAKSKSLTDVLSIFDKPLHLVPQHG